MKTENERAIQDARRFAAGLMTRKEFEDKHPGIQIRRVPAGAALEHKRSGLRDVARV